MSQPRQPLRPSFNNFWILSALMILYSVLLHHAYRDLISPIFFYLGLTYRSPNVAQQVTSIVLVCVLVVVMPRRSGKPSEFVLWMVLLVAISPTILIAQYADILDSGKALQLALLVFGVYLALIGATRKGLPKFELRVALPPSIPPLLLIGLTIGVNLLLLITSGENIRLTTFDAVQDVRETYKLAVAGIPVFGYLVQLQMAVLNPVILAIGASRKKLIPIVAGTAGQVLIYGITGYKLAILSPVFIVALAFHLRHKRTISALSLVSGVAAAMTLSLGLDAALGGRFFTTVFINRLLAAPGVLTSAYVKVFDEHPRYYWSYSFLSGFLDSPSQLNPAYFVGRVFQGKDIQANVNFIGDGYANAGTLGILIEATVLLLIFTALDASARGIPIAVSIPSTIVAALGLSNTSSFTSILTGGFAGLIIVFALWPRAKIDAGGIASDQGVDAGADSRTASQPRSHNTP